MATTSAAKLSLLREKMKEHGLDALIVNSEDAHQSEYVGESERRRQFISGFSGSAGTAFVGMEGAWLWTDSRYLLQASQQLDTSVWTVMHSLPRQASMAEHAAAELPQGSRIGADPWLLPLATYQTLQDKLSSREHVLVPLTNNLVDELWDSRPRPPKGKAFAHPVRLSGSSTKEKLERTRKELRELGASAMVISSLDEVAWLLNVRGDDIPYNPFVVSYVILTMEETKWFVDEEKVDESLRASLQDDGVSIFSYSSLEEHLVLLAKGCGSVLVDPAKCSWKVYMILTPETKEEMVEQCKVITQLSPVCTLKAIKTEEELQGFRDAHLKDAAAMVNFLCWIEKAMEDNVHLTEVSAADKLLEFRKQQQGFVSLSFETISAYGSNGAIIHYSPEAETCSTIGKDSLYLLDSGAQFYEGTTDITRTMHFGSPTSHERSCFTRVLQGHIALDSAVFPLGTTGHMLDLLARLPLWKAGLDYKHGTGHGVGAFLCVHEGPHLISYYPKDPDPPIRRGMTSSIEPGYYEEGNFGIRIENVVYVREARTEHKFDGIEFLTFEPLTVVPLERKLIDKTMLSEEEVRWVDEYHRLCWEQVAPRVEGDAKEWLRRMTQPL